MKIKKLLAAICIAGTAACLAAGLARCHKKSSHTHDLKETAAVAATCTTDGNSAYWYCEGCEKYFADTAKAATYLTSTHNITLGSARRIKIVEVKM